MKPQILKGTHRPYRRVIFSYRYMHNRACCIVYSINFLLFKLLIFLRQYFIYFYFIFQFSWISNFYLFILFYFIFSFFYFLSLASCCCCLRDGLCYAQVVLVFIDCVSFPFWNEQDPCLFAQRDDPRRHSSLCPATRLLRCMPHLVNAAVLAADMVNTLYISAPRIRRVTATRLTIEKSPLKK